MIHIVTSANRADYEPQIENDFRIRHDIYVGERKWMNLAKPDGRECDQFDNDDAIYLLAIEGQKVVGGSRLIPTLKPHLLDEVFPHLAQKGVPRAHNIYEWTRVHVIKERREGRNRGVALGSLFCGVLEYCLARDVVALTALVEMWWLPHFHEMGWTLDPLGLPELINGEWSIAISLSIDRRTLETTREMFGIREPVLAPVARKAPSRIEVPA
jgi:acyl-homoserine lactone synthase